MFVVELECDWSKKTARTKTNKQKHQEGRVTRVSSERDWKFCLFFLLDVGFTFVVPTRDWKKTVRRAHMALPRSEPDRS